MNTSPQKFRELLKQRLDEVIKIIYNIKKIDKIMYI